jgi:hypothetical protein
MAGTASFADDSYASEINTDLPTQRRFQTEAIY